MGSDNDELRSKVRAGFEIRLLTWSERPSLNAEFTHLAEPTEKTLCYRRRSDHARDPIDYASGSMSACDSRFAIVTLVEACFL